VSSGKDLIAAVYISVYIGVYMGSKVVSTRVDEDVLKELEREGVNPSQVSRKAIETEAARIRTQRALGVLKKKAVRSRESAVDIIRRLREES
jgi:short-subunit dehydrogenase